MIGAESVLLCATCGEPNSPERKEFWFCKASLEDATEVPADSIEERPRSALSEVATIVMALAVATVCLGTFTSAPGSGIFLSIVMVIPLLRTTAVMSRRKKKGMAASSGTTMLLFLCSMSVTWIILSVVGIVAFGTFCFTCIAVADLAKDDNTAIAIASLATLVVVGLSCWAFSKWVRRRWRRDIGVRRK